MKKGILMKKMYLCLLGILYTNTTTTETNHNLQQRPGVTIHIDASTNAKLPQTNLTDLQARQTSQPCNETSTVVQANNKQSAEEEENRKKTESTARYCVRNGAKLAIVAGISMYGPTWLSYGYWANRLIVQPLLDNGDLFTEDGDINALPCYEYARRQYQKSQNKQSSKDVV